MQQVHVSGQGVHDSRDSRSAVSAPRHPLEESGDVKPASLAQSVVFDDIAFDTEEVDAMLQESGIRSDLDADVQRWLATRVMVAMSLAAIVVADEDYYECIESLGAAPVGEMADFMRALTEHASQEVLGTLPPPEQPMDAFEVLRRRLADTETLIGSF